MLRNTKLTPNSLTVIAKNMEDQKSLRKLDLSYNLFSQEAVNILFDCLTRNQILSTLILNHCELEYIEVRGQKKLSINTLDISYNNFSDRNSSGKLAVVIKNNPSITDLDISYNMEIGTDGLDDLIDALNSNITLLKLNISGLSFANKECRTRTKPYDLIANYIASTSTLKSLSISSIEWPIEEEVKRNTNIIIQSPPKKIINSLMINKSLEKYINTK